jgi:hypothetical protein
VTAEGLTRRTMLRRSGAAALALGVPTLLAACGKTTPAQKVEPIFLIHIGSEAPRPEDLVRLITRRARQLHVYPILSKDPEALEPLQLAVKPGEFDPETNKASALAAPLVFNATQTARLEPVAAEAIGRGTPLIPYPVPLKHQTAAIVFDATRAATELAEGAIAWASRHLDEPAEVLLVLPKAEGGDAIYALTSEAANIEHAWRSTLAGAAGSLSVGRVYRGSAEEVGEELVAPIVRSSPRTRIVLCWEDQIAIGVAKALRRQPPTGVTAGDLLVACLGAPTAFMRTTFAELESGGPFQLMVTARATDLANAIVDLPTAVLKGESIESVTLPLSTLTPGSKLIPRFSQEYLPHESSEYQIYEGVPLNGGAL